MGSGRNVIEFEKAAMRLRAQRQDDRMILVDKEALELALSLLSSASSRRQDAPKNPEPVILTPQEPLPWPS